uniref:Uncharacterized protein n=1 Tax=Chelonoidis abingdonii TaxID=106734 RepID=A0A8C0HBB2_CHEAB
MLTLQQANGLKANVFIHGCSNRRELIFRGAEHPQLPWTQMIPLHNFFLLPDPDATSPESSHSEVAYIIICHIMQRNFCKFFSLCALCCCVFLSYITGMLSFPAYVRK